MTKTSEQPQPNLREYAHLMRIAKENLISIIDGYNRTCHAAVELRSFSDRYIQIFTHGPKLEISQRNSRFMGELLTACKADRISESLATVSAFIPKDILRFANLLAKAAAKYDKESAPASAIQHAAEFDSPHIAKHLGLASVWNLFDSARDCPKYTTALGIVKAWSGLIDALPVKQKISSEEVSAFLKEKGIQRRNGGYEKKGATVLLDFAESLKGLQR